MSQTLPVTSGDVVLTRMQPRIRVLLADKDERHSEALAFTLESDPDLEVVGVLGAPDLGVAQAQKAPSDVVLVSYPLLQSDGERLLGALRKENPDVKSIILTPDPDDEMLTNCFDAGAVGYVSEDRAASELVGRIKRAHKGEALWSSAELIRIMEHKRPRSGPVRASPAPREIEALQALVNGESIDEVAERFGIARSKLKLEAVVIALRAGLISLQEASQD